MGITKLPVKFTVLNIIITLTAALLCRSQMLQVRDMAKQRCLCCRWALQLEQSAMLIALGHFKWALKMQLFTF